MPRLPKLLSKALIAELELTPEGKAQIAKTNADNDRIWPEPELGDILTLKQRLENDRSRWAAKVQQVRVMRFNEDTTPPKWAQRLNLPDDRRIHTNLTGNEINRVVATMERNPPRVTISPASDSNPAIQRAEIQARWCQKLISAVESDPLTPVWAIGSDAAAETGLGGFEWYMTDAWDDVEELIAQVDPEAPDPDLMNQIDEAKKIAGIPFALRPLDSLSLLFEKDNYGVSRALIVERKHYAQVYQSVQAKLSTEEAEKLRLPPVGARAWPDTSRLIRYQYMGENRDYDVSPVEGDLVEVLRYYDRRWMVEVVAGRITESKEHRLPGIPVFPQLGKVTSSASTEYMVQGITFGITSLELALNDMFTFGADNIYTYGRPFPVVETSENGQNLLDKEGNPYPIQLNDPSKAPQLGPGQKIADAFNGFTGHIEAPFLSALQSYYERSGLNPIASGDSPGADPSGFALNTLNTGAQALYESMLDNKVKTQAAFCDFSRMAIKSTIGEKVYLSVPTADGQGVEYIAIGPDDIDKVPTVVYIDPKSDMQRLAIISMLSTAWQQKLIQKRTVQTLGFTGIIEDPDQEDRGIYLEALQEMSLPGMLQSIIAQVQADAMPEAAPAMAGPGAPGAPSPGAPQGPNGTGPQDLQQQGITPPRGVSVGNPAPKPAVAEANRGRAGQQPANQGVPVLGG